MEQGGNNAIIRAMEERKKQIIRNWMIAFSLWVILFFICYLGMGIPKGHTWYSSLSLLSDSFFIPSAILILFPILLLIGREGIFDVFAYGFYRLGESFRPGNIKRYETAYDYKKEKQEKRKLNKPYFLPYFVLGGVSLLIGLILALVE